jgi:hypothetical protein
MSVVKELKSKQSFFIKLAIIFFILMFVTNLVVFEDKQIELLNIIMNTIFSLIFLSSAWITSYYYGKLEANGEKVTMPAILTIVISGIIPGVIAFIIGKKK